MQTAQSRAKVKNIYEIGARWPGRKMTSLSKKSAEIPDIRAFSRIGFAVGQVHVYLFKFQVEEKIEE